jgi:hypothetical protein
MWLTDMDGDGLVDVVSADHTAHRGVWHKNPGIDSDELWTQYAIFRNVRMPGDFAMMDMDTDGDLDWVGTSMTWGQAVIVEQVEPESSMIATVSLPEGFDEKITKLLIFLADEVPVRGIPKPVLVNIDNTDADGDGEMDVDQNLSQSQDMVLTIEDVTVKGDYHVVAVVYVEGGGKFQPKSGVDYMAHSEKLTLGQGQVKVSLIPELAP